LPRLRQAGADLERHLYAVARIGRCPIERPAFHSGSVQESASHALVVFVTARGDDDGPSRLEEKRLSLAQRLYPDHLAVPVNDQLLGARLVVNLDAAGLYAVQQTRIERLAPLLLRLRRVLGEPGLHLRILAPGVIAQRKPVS